VGRFRCIAFRDVKTVELQSKSGQSLGRYFPEIVEAVLKVKATRFVIDGELMGGKGGLIGKLIVFLFPGRDLIATDMRGIQSHLGGPNLKECRTGSGITEPEQ